MDDVITRMLEDEIKDELSGLKSFSNGSKEKTEAINHLAKLYELKIEEGKCETDLIAKREEVNNNEFDRALKDDQLRQDSKDRYFRYGIEAAGIVLPLIFYASWMRKGFKFEESGTFTSATFKGLINRFRTTK